jgi:hypothetical protein
MFSTKKGGIKSDTTHKRTNIETNFDSFSYNFVFKISETP